MIGVPRRTWTLAGELRDALAARSGRRVSLSETVERGLECLRDSHVRGAWLTPQEAAPVMEARMRAEIVSAIKQFLGRWSPETVLHGVGFAPSKIPGGGGTLTVHLEGGEVPILLGGAEFVASEAGEGPHA